MASDNTAEGRSQQNLPPDIVTSHGESGDSDPEHQHQLEVLFGPEGDHRRKSSLVSNDNPRISRRHGSNSSRRNTSCFVHSLLGVDGPDDHLGDNSDPFARCTGCGAEGPDSVNHEDNDVSVIDFGDRSQGETSAVDIVHSRLLTKKQLSDMAWNVRALSKKLGGIKLRINVRTVFILTKAYDESLVALTRELTRWLLSKERDSRYIVYVEHVLSTNRLFDAKGLVDEEASAEGRLKYWDEQLAHDHPHTFDLAITLGGDGTVLYTSWLFQRIVPPVMSFSLGSLGFLTKFDFENYQESLTKAFRDGVAISLRLRFECTIMRSKPREKEISGRGEPPKRDLVEELIGEESEDDVTHAPDKMFEILNDIVVDRGPNPTMSSIEIFGDDEHFTTVQADGVCVATPTGSTAYNLAAGGSLSHPENPVILVTAICAHTLSFRPIILPDTIVLRVGVPYDARTGSWASFDGRERMELRPGDYVTISASRYPFANVMPPGRRSEGWIQSISKTLHWNSRQKQKSYNVWKDDSQSSTKARE